MKRFQEGMRRVGLTLAVLGALTGGGTAGVVYMGVYERHSDAISWEIAASEGRTGTANGLLTIMAGHPPQSSISSAEFTPPALESKVLDSFYSEPKRPDWWEYPAPLLLPILGFLLPWGSVRIVRWNATGFMQHEHR